MRGPVVLLCLSVLVCARVAAQQPAAPDSAKRDSAPLPLSPVQEKYLHGLKSVGRGVAQLKTGVDRLSRAQASGDTPRQRQAATLLGGFCGSARSFLASGRAQMQPTAYEDSTRIKAQWLTAQVDTLIQFMPTCEAQAAKTPATLAVDLVARLRSYDAALKDFRGAVGLPTR